MDKKLELFSALKGDLENAPVEVKEAYNKVVAFFDEGSQTDKFNKLAQDAKQRCINRANKLFKSVEEVPVKKLKEDDLIFLADDWFYDPSSGGDETGEYVCKVDENDLSKRKGNFTSKVVKVISTPDYPRGGKGESLVSKVGDTIILIPFEDIDNPNATYLRIKE